MQINETEINVLILFILSDYMSVFFYAFMTDERFKSKSQAKVIKS